MLLKEALNLHRDLPCGPTKVPLPRVRRFGRGVPRGSCRGFLGAGRDIQLTMFEHCIQHVYIHMHACMHACMDGWMDGWMYVCVYVCMYVCMYVCNYV